MMSSQRSTEASKRPDALASSRHTRLADQIQKPAGSRDLQRAEAVCAEVSRAALGDFAPALLLLSPGQRRRAQALTAYAVTLFDFARQGGLDGERLAQINRWEFDLDSALDGVPPSQPVFLLLASEQHRDPWPVEGFEKLNGAARRRVAARRPETVQDSERETARAALALCTLLLGAHRRPGAEALANALLRIANLKSLGEGIRRHDSWLAKTLLPDDFEGSRDQLASIEAVIRDECAQILSQLAPSLKDIPDLDSRMRRCLRYLQLAGKALLGRMGRSGAGILERPPKLGLGARLALLARARVFRG